MVESIHMDDQTSKQNNRYDLIDTLRGLEIISMIAFHTCWLLNHFGLGISTEILFGTAFTVWERSICIGFILIAGFSFRFGHRHLRKGLLVFGCGAIITLVTCLFLPQIRIVFGVLTLIGTASLLMIPIDRALEDKVNGSVKFDLAGALISLLLFIADYNINKGYIGFMPGAAIQLPAAMYKGYLMTFLGFMEPGFFSTDYFSLLPWIFVYACGYFLHIPVISWQRTREYIKHGIPGISAIGRHSLPIYMVHPIIIYAVLYLIAQYLL